MEDQLPQDFLDLIGLEDEVAGCRGFQPCIIPGLFQTEAYATAVIQGGSARPPSEAQLTKVRVRLERQKAMTGRRPEPLHVWMVLGEAPLRQ
ncbi:Scr1 family TA system antitoxin-like transcriptional regulator [Streptomyces sp. NPDC018352]|uniref:Scr1 family TA system antitoxin-like transcriptional regulator n=1 Tax=Streptomyces sp. NPDC018352 TaxID=3157194 RepID=UPI0033DFD29A